MIQKMREERDKGYYKKNQNQRNNFLKKENN